MKKVTIKIRTASLSALAQHILTIGKQVENPKDERLPGLFDELGKLSEELTEAIHRDRLQNRLSGLDAERDRQIRSLSALLKGYKAHPDAEKSRAAAELLAVFQKYGIGIANKRYGEESALIESLLKDFVSEDLAKAVGALDGIPETLESLRKIQDDFATENREFNSAVVNRGENATQLKKRVLEFLNQKFIPYLDAVEAVSGADSAFSRQIALEVEKANASAQKSAEKPGEQTVIPDKGEELLENG